MTDSTPFRLPPALIKRAREFDGKPAPVRDAATVVLLRPSEQTFQLYVLRRATTMAFGGLYAFPGGGVDPDDRPEPIRTDWPARLGAPADRAHAVVGAAVRELFEETGVLLAGPVEQPDRTIADVGTDDWEADRAAVLARELTLSDLLRRRGLRMRDDLLFPWARWVTPEFEPKRYDTWFFVSLLPEGQLPRDVSGESEDTTWITAADSAGLAMLPPTRSVIDSLTPYGEMAQVVAAASRRDAATPVTPRVELTNDGGALLHLQ
ncbi:NUDIX hydrolase [Paractinoplanes lichenicola]|uniref:NUDIX domain-containing protein n=1 Tax=Paractinoplanes lichenicola TaxID=2802976 RepID=A0ABS1VM70_9ACTN|nr:NUDIX domain-containing protein [Actinoplanes lichenicola]MBL7254581.1 NUDIX domain-containing protein [Actinoplanes lichenicola]